MFHKFELNKAEFILEPSLNYNAEETKYIEECWESEKKKKPNIHNGLGYALTSISKDPLILKFAPADYKSSIAIVNYNPNFRCYSRIATSIVLKTENKVYLGKRNTNVGTFAGIYNHFGGLVDYNENIKNEDFPDYLISETLRELKEEVEFHNEPNINRLNFLGVNVTDDKYVTDFFFTYNEKPIKTIDSENTEIKELTLADLKYNTQNIKVSPILLEAIDYII